MPTKDSVFMSAVRTFCVVLAGFFAILCGFFLLSAAFFSPKVLPLQATPSDVIIYPDEHGNRALLSESTPVILRLNIHGVIGQGNLSQEKVEGMLLDARNGTLRKGRLKAIILHINSPGGIAEDSFGIYAALKELKEELSIPLYAYVEGSCMSGAMFIACAADKIYASAASSVGSVGVIVGPSFNVSSAMEKYGVASKTITQGKDKDMLNPYRPWKENEGQSITTLVEALYDQFVAVVTTNRPKISEAMLRDTLGANVFISYEAEKLGYIDVAGVPYHKALHDLAETAKLNQYQVLRIRPPVNLYESVFGKGESGNGAQVDHVVHFGKKWGEALQGRNLFYYDQN